MSTVATESQLPTEPSKPSIGREETAAASRSTRAACSALFTLGLVARLAPLLDHGGRLLAQFPTEDGYFMLTMARNISLGHGLSVAGGAFPTNGTQPLATFLWSFAYSLVGGDPVAGVAAVLGLEVAISALAAHGIFRLVQRVFAHRADAATLAWIASSVWFASAIVLPNTMNCLETGLYTAVAVAVALAFVESAEPNPPVMGVRRALSVGALLGIVFWARNDAVFLILGACLAYLYGGLEGGRRVVVARFGRTLMFGATSVVVALPWMIHNYVGFGHPMPVSGRAESVTATFAGNLAHVPAHLVEVLALVVPVPHSVETHPAVVTLGALAAFAAMITLAARCRSAERPVRHLALMVGIYAFGLACFYGLFFGAPWFIGRYFAPLSPFTAILWAVSVKTAVDRLTPSPRALAAPLVAAFAISLALNGRFYLAGDRHEHFQVVAWVRENVPEETWVAAVQTGTLGYFHERTINLDGKVNLAAYEALTAGRIHSYVVASEAEYLVDWVGITDWMREPEIAAAFEVLVQDPERNLGVLRRRRGAAAHDEADGR